MQSERVTITVLTATLNAGQYLPDLIESLKKQTDADFQWVVFDGNSTDTTFALLSEAQQALSVRILQARDFGIYDALNRGLEYVDTNYYVVVGADDCLSPEAIQMYRQTALLAGMPDFVAASVRVRDKIQFPRFNQGWRYAMSGVSSCHSVGLLIKRSLHARFGMYSHRLPIAADQLFVKSALAGGASISRERFIAGTFATTGTSETDTIGVLTEVFRVQLATERYKSLQYLLFLLRILRHAVRYGIHRIGSNRI